MTGPNDRRVPQVKRNEGVCLDSLHLRELEAPEKAVPRGSVPTPTWSITICLHLRGVLTSPEVGFTSSRQEPAGQRLSPGSSGSRPAWLSMLTEALTPSWEDPWVIKSWGGGGAEAQLHL